MKRIQVNISVSANINQDEFTALLPQELETINKWKEKGLLEHSFVKENKTGAILILTEIDEQKVKERISELPLFPFFEKVEYTVVTKQF